MLERGASLIGIFALVGLAYTFSTARHKIRWRIVVVGISLQLYLAMFIVRADWVPVLLTVAAGACAAILLYSKLPGYWNPAARGLGVLAAVTVIVHLAIHHQAWWALLAILLLPTVWVHAGHAASIAAHLALIGCVWMWGLPDNFLFQSLQGIGNAVNWFSNQAVEASGLIFGGLREREGGFLFAINVSAIILFYSALMSMLYHVGVLGWLVGLLARVMRRSMGVTGAESLACASNVFLGQTEAPLVVRPYLDRMTKSELTALMAGGFATIAGSVLGIYIQFLDKAGFTLGAAHLISASIMSAPAAFVFAKLLVPETEEPMIEKAHLPRDKLGVNLLDSLTGGVTAGLKLAVNVLAMLLVFNTLVMILDKGVGWSVNEIWPGRDLTFRNLYGYLFSPFALLMGVPWGDCLKVGELMGTKTIFNEFLAYSALGDMIKAGEIGARATVLSTYALCGFANFMSIGVQIGGLSQLAPGRRSDFSRLALRAMIAGALACQLTACIVGVIGRF
jgi:CNT family concentrative nucleoside transporter